MGILLGASLRIPPQIMAVSESSISQNRRDGTWWTEQGELEKLKYAIGFLDGIELGNEFSYWGVIVPGEHSDCLDRVAKSFESYSSKFLNNLSAGQFASGLDEFYKDYRNRRIQIATATWIVLNEIAGTPRLKIDALIENSRKNASK